MLELENLVWGAFVEYFKLLNNPNHQQKMLESCVDDYEDYIASFIIKTDILPEQKKNLQIKKLGNKKYELTFNHKDYDGMGIIQLFSNKKLNEIMPNNFFLYNFYPTKNIANIPYFVKNYFQQPYYNKNINKLSYEYSILEKQKIKQIKEKYGIHNTTNFIFSLLILNFFKETTCQFAKVANIIYMPWIKGGVKVMKFPFVIKRSLHISEIYKEVEKNKFSIMDAWGLYYWINFYKKYIEFIKDNSVVHDDIVISNVPLCLDFDYIKITNSQQRASLYVFGLGNKDNNINLSFSIDKSLPTYHKNFNKLYKSANLDLT